MSNHDKYREAMKRNLNKWKRRKQKLHYLLSRVPTPMTPLEPKQCVDYLNHLVDDPDSFLVWALRDLTREDDTPTYKVNGAAPVLRCFTSREDADAFLRAHPPEEGFSVVSFLAGEFLSWLRSCRAEGVELIYLDRAGFRIDDILHLPRPQLREPVTDAADSVTEETQDMMNLMLPPEAHEWAARETLRLQDELQRRIRDRIRRERPDVPLLERGSKLGTTAEHATYLHQVYDEELARLLAEQTAEIEGDDQ